MKMQIKCQEMPYPINLKNYIFRFRILLF